MGFGARFAVEFNRLHGVMSLLDFVLCVRIWSYSIKMLSTSACVIVKLQIHNFSKLGQTACIQLKGSWMLFGRSACSVISETVNLRSFAVTELCFQEEQLDAYCL